DKVIITIPAGLLQDKDGGGGTIEFFPPIPEKLKEIDLLGYGSALKVVVQFDHPFWQDKEMIAQHGEAIQSLGFLLSDAPIPTWWTQMPGNIPVLTGWVGGPKATEFSQYFDEDILHMAINSLAHIFGISTQVLKKALVAHH